MISARREWQASYAFIELNVRAIKRYWGWEAVWLAFAIVNSLTVAYIAPGGREVTGEAFATDRLVLFLVIGTIVWAYLQQVFDSVGFMIAWQRWEGTIESTFMAPARRLTMVAGTSTFAIVYAFVRALVVLGVVSLFFDLDLLQANWLTALAVICAGSIGFLGLAVMAAALPLLFLERGEQMVMITLAALLLVSGVFYPIEVLPGWLQAVGHLSPATYVLEGMRAAVLDGASLGDVAGLFPPLLAIAAVVLPLGIVVFRTAERYALRSGRLKRHG